MKNQTNIEKLVTSQKSVFTTDDLAIIWNIADRQKLIGRIKYYLRKQRLIHVYKGVYAYGDYTPLEVAQKLVPASYLSLYTTSQLHGLSFQHYSSVYCMSLSSKTYSIDGQKFVYHKLKPAAFYSNLGLIDTGRYIMASRERTICDMLYVWPQAAFDNLASVDSKLLLQISAIYDNKRLQKDIDRLITKLERS